MKGLILKDFYISRGSIIFLTVFVILYSIITGLSFKSNYWAGIMIVMTGTLGRTAFEYEIKTKWDKYEGALPVSVKQRVAGKFIFAIISIIIISFIAFATICIMDINFNKLNVLENLSVVFMRISLAIMLASLYIVFTYRFGIAKSRIFVIITCASLGGLLGGLSGVMSHNEQWQVIFQLGLVTRSILFLTFSLIFCFIMYNISVHIVNKNKSR